MADVWTYKVPDTHGKAVVGFDVEATDGSIGKIDEASDEAGSSFLVVDTGFWIFGKKRMIPARAVERIDLEDNKVYVSLTKDQIKDAPDWDETRSDHDEYRRDVGTYYNRY